ncbi:MULTISPECIES: flagellar hook-length control protein FliK [unclassified Sphingomonas]|uniref:flagellar hook-length control protein FliK n=1 Tax=unclassified Sphingomonas TaxID=196159 RepID=UPI0025DD42DC|nr:MULTISPECIES: flagellar hook-length control protein FliK [unclassified Sphingomonas]
MITAAAAAASAAAPAVSPTVPGQPAKGGSPAAGDLFALSMMAVGAGEGAMADTGDALARQPFAAPGMTLPTAAAPAIDPALAWLPAVDIPIPAPMEVPPALAKVVTVPAPVVSAPVLRRGTAVAALAVATAAPVVAAAVRPTPVPSADGVQPDAAVAGESVTRVPVPSRGAAPVVAEDGVAQDAAIVRDPSRSVVPSVVADPYGLPESDGQVSPAIGGEPVASTAPVIADASVDPRPNPAPVRDLLMADAPDVPGRPAGRQAVPADTIRPMVDDATLPAPVAGDVASPLAPVVADANPDVPAPIMRDVAAGKATAPRKVAGDALAAQPVGRSVAEPLQADSPAVESDEDDMRDASEIVPLVQPDPGAAILALAPQPVALPIDRPVAPTAPVRAAPDAVDAAPVVGIAASRAPVAPVVAEGVSVDALSPSFATAVPADGAAPIADPEIQDARDAAVSARSDTAGRARERTPGRSDSPAVAIAPPPAAPTMVADDAQPAAVSTAPQAMVEPAAVPIARGASKIRASRPSQHGEDVGPAPVAAPPRSDARPLLPEAIALTAPPLPVAPIRPSAQRSATAADTGAAPVSAPNATPAVPAAPAPVRAEAVVAPASPIVTPVIAVAAPVLVAAAPVIDAPATVAPAVADVAPSPVEPRQTFMREVSGNARQTVALRPQAAASVQPVAGTTAPAAQVFGAAMHAAAGKEDRVRAEPIDPAITATAVAAPVREVAAVADAGAPTLDMRQSGWPTHMVDHIEALRDAANANDTRIRLVPDALGAIDIAVRTVGDAIHVRFAAEDSVTRTMIEDAQPRLAEIAQERGLKIGQTIVEPAPAAGQAHAGQSGTGQSAAGNGQQQASAQAQAQAGQQQPRQQPQQQAATGRQPAGAARAPTPDKDAAANGRIA